jgi:predicted permease
MRIPVKRGRAFDARDRQGAPLAVVVDERLARRFWGDQDPIGRRMYQPNSAGEVLGPTPATEWLTVVGVVGDVKQDGLVPDETPVGTYYFPVAQNAGRTLGFVVRSSGDPKTLAPAVRAAVAGIDPELPVYGVKTMEEVTDESLVTRRWPLRLALGFGVVALLLSAVGIYGVLAYLVTQRTKEIGVRMALGGSPRSIFDLVLREGVVLLAVGLAGGAAGLVALQRAISAQLFGVGAAEPAVLAAATLTLGTVALLACAIPARRATRIDPVLALNRE